MDKPPGGMSIKDVGMAGYCRPPIRRRAVASASRTRGRSCMRTATHPETDRQGGVNRPVFHSDAAAGLYRRASYTTADWDVVFDDRGSFIEPHTGHVVPLGTVEVRQYYGERPPDRPLASSQRWPDGVNGRPDNRYLHILFIEKEGFSALLARARIAERFDVAIMSTKGMSVTAARWLLDRLAPQIKSVLVLHDFDVSGILVSSARWARADGAIASITTFMLSISACGSTI